MSKNKKEKPKKESKYIGFLIGSDKLDFIEQISKRAVSSKDISRTSKKIRIGKDKLLSSKHLEEKSQLKKSKKSKE